CGAVCFSSACTNGYCFDGSGADEYATCKLNHSATEPYESAALWADGSGKYQTLAVPNTTITARYIIEFRCYTAKDPTVDISSLNNAPMYRITAYVIGEGGRARAMLRSTVKET